MDIRVLQASQTGNIYFLHQLLIENPLILHKNAILSTENPLHIASISGHLDLAKEMVSLKPEFTKEINQDEFNPLHIAAAAAAGHIELVQELMKPDPNLLCRLASKEKTPLRFAAIKGRVGVISAMLLACPDCIEDVTLQKETALHLAVKNNQMEAVRAMVDWIRDMKNDDVLNMKEEGNTVLHLATWKKQRQVVELFLDDETIRLGSLEVNAMNCSGPTALDVLMIFPSEAGDREIAEILWRAGAMMSTMRWGYLAQLMVRNRNFHFVRHLLESHF